MDEITLKRKRGRYKTWLFNPNLKVPRTTLWDRKQRDAAALRGNNHDQDDEGGHGHDQQVSSDDEGDIGQDSSQDHQVSSDDEGDINQDSSQNQQMANDDDEQDQMSDSGDGDGQGQQILNEETEHTEEVTGCKSKVNYIIKYNLHQRLHKDFDLSRLDVLLMILHLAIRHSHTEPFVIDQIEFVNTLFGDNVLDISYHIFKELFPSSKGIVKHYFCLECQISLGSDKDFVGLKETVCQKCQKVYKVNTIDSDNYFVILNIKEQIEKLLQRPNIKLIDFTTRQQPNGNICDIFDGEIYSKCLESGLDLENALTVTVNTDGVAVHDSTTKSMYPIFLHLNEIIPEQRFQVDNLILGGLWFSRSAPTMALFLKPFLEQLLDLSAGGVKQSKPDGTVITFKVYPMACSLDSVAKPKVLCQKQFNGHCACLYCMHPNDGKVEGSKLLFYDTSKSYPNRTEMQVMKDMYVADTKERAGHLKQKDSVNGFLGISILLIFTKMLQFSPCNTFNIVWGVVIDYMHASLEGVTHQLLELYVQILTPQQLEVLNDRLDKITPPMAMTRKPRNLTEKIKWKAKETRAFLLYYSVPCLEDLLPARHFRNLKHFVSAMHILLGDVITPQCLIQARSHLDTFVTKFQALYGLVNVSYNLHLHSHLCDLVAMVGPLWCYSNFMFESGNGRLIKLIKGTRSIINEIAKKFTKLQHVSKIIEENPINKRALDFCNKLLNYDHSESSKIVDGVRVTGSVSSALVSSDLTGLLLCNKIKVDNNTVKFYNRVFRRHILYTSKSYTKTKVYDDSCVILNDGQFAIIDKIIENNEGSLLCLIKLLNIAEKVIPSIHKCAFNFEGDFAIVPFDKILSKCVFVSFGSSNYVCRIPNFFERD